MIDVAPKDENVQATVNELLALEKRFLSLQGEADSLERLNLWTHMGTLNARLARARDAGLCWVHSVWEQDIETSLPVMQAWTTMETSPASIAKKKAEVWALSAPQSENVRALAVVFMYERFTNVAISQDELQRYSNFFDKYDDCLDLRTLWLLRHSLSQSLGGDRLGLARTRDRILTKLHRGLSVERDVPAFLRFISGGRDTNQVEALSTQLQVSLEAFDKIKRNRSAVEASPALTRPYIQLIVAYGYARLGQSEKARALVKVAQASLPQTDPIHSFISRAYVSRIESALEGLPSDQPLPPALEGELNKVEKFSRYKIDRLRQYSNILEQNENIDAVKGFQLGHADPRGEKFAGLRGMTDSAALFVELERIVRQTISQPAAIRADDFDSALDFFPRITEVQAVPLLEAILQNIDDITPEKRARIYRDVLSVAGHFSNEPIVKRVLQNFTPLLASLGAEHVAQVGTMVSESLRSLRRVGLREEASALLDTLSQVAQGRTTPMLAARLHFAGGSAFLGHTEKAIPIFEEAQRALEAPATAMLIPDRLHITRALCRSLSQTSQEYAIASLRKVLDHLPKISDSFNTNSHFSLSVLAFYESLVLGLASDELTLGEVGRRWLDEDEYLIRRRIHHDLSRVR